MSISWYQYFCDLLEVLKTKSKDPSTQVAAIISDQNMAIISTGFNGFPMGVKDIDDRYENRELKYQLIVHAEMNAITLAARRGTPLQNSIIWVSKFPCVECTKAIIQSGISKVCIFTCDSDSAFNERWKHSIELSRMMLDESKVEINILNKDSI